MREAEAESTPRTIATMDGDDDGGTGEQLRRLDASLKDELM